MLNTWKTESFKKKNNNLNWQNFEHSVKWYLPKIYSQWPSNFHGADTTILITLCSLLSDDFAASKLLLVSMSSSWKMYWCPYSRVGHWSDSCFKSFCNYKLLQSFDNQLFQFFQEPDFKFRWVFSAGGGRLFTFYCSPVHNALLVLLTRLTIFNSFNGSPPLVLVLFKVFFSFLSILQLDFLPIRI